MDSMSTAIKIKVKTADRLYMCEFCGDANTMDFMYWVQGAESYVDNPNCCAECVEDQCDDDDSDSDDDA